MTWRVFICLLGGFRVLCDGTPLPVPADGKSAGLLSQLALRSVHNVPREVLLDLLWPDWDASRAGQSLNSLVYSIQKMFGAVLGGAHPIIQTDGYYRLNTSAGIGVDVACFTELADEGDAYLRVDNPAAAVAAYRQAACYYAGDLYGTNDIAAVVEREHLRARYLTILARLADHDFGQGDYAACLEHVSDVLAYDPFREDAHRLAMRCYVRLGERAQALRQFRLCQESLQAEFDIAPEEATLALYAQVRLAPGSI